MYKSLNIAYYTDGYNANHINCIDIPIAGATGYYNYDNYYIYSFYYCYFNNWGTENDNTRENILKKMGLSMQSQTPINDCEFISLIKQLIDNSHPVVMMPNYNALFYYNDYLNNNNK